jgi:thymidylate kinase
MLKADHMLDRPLASSLVATTNCMLPIFESLLVDFIRQDIRCCYWKSTRRLKSALAGERDLDLLVARQDQHRTEMVLLAAGFKRFPAIATRDHPSLSSFLGHDEQSGRLVHVHLHARLIVGEPLFKNYRLPWEDIILARAELHAELPIRVLDPTTEALLLAVRSCLELSRLDPVTLRSWHAAIHKFALDHAKLGAHVDRAALHELATVLLDKDLAGMIVDFICGEPRRDDRRRFRRCLTRRSAIYRTYNPFESRLRSAWRTALWIGGNLNRRYFHIPRPWSRRAPGGGCVVAIVGLDGSGKTTVTAALRAWLAPEVDVMPVYFGTGAGRPSMLLRPFKLMVPLIRCVLRTKPKGSSHGTISEQPPGRLYSACMMCWAALVAYEKRGKLRVARRAADRGLVVVTDRFPQDEIIGFNDGPLLARLSRVPAWLRTFETSAYALARRLPPDLVLKLDVRAETAARREPDMDPNLIRQRIAQLRRLTFASPRVVTVDAEQPLEDVIRVAKREIWQLL